MPNLKTSLISIIGSNNNKPSRTFDITIIMVILLSMITFSMGTIPKLDNTLKYYIDLLDNLFIIIFTIEYILRIYITDKKLKYIFSFYGLIDLLSILPFFIGLFYDGQYLKVLRLLRIFRLLKLTRYSKTVSKFGKAFYNSREEFVIFIFITFIIFFISSVGIYQFEHKAQPEAFGSVFQSMWWAVATLTTVGYGDVYPITIGGKIFTTLMLILGLGIVGVPAGIIAASFTEIGIDDEQNKNKDQDSS